MKKEQGQFLKICREEISSCEEAAYGQDSQMQGGPSICVGREEGQDPDGNDRSHQRCDHGEGATRAVAWQAAAME